LGIGLVPVFRLASSVFNQCK